VKYLQERDIEAFRGFLPSKRAKNRDFSSLSAVTMPYVVKSASILGERAIFWTPKCLDNGVSIKKTA
jgi:hypothetical protein